MNVFLWFVGGLAATTVLTTILAASQALHFTRMNIPHILGTMVTPDRDRAAPIGFAMHFVNGWIFALIYVAALAQWRASAFRGALIGLVHALFVLLVALPVLAAVHPRMASDELGPSATRALQPPGVLALHYGWHTPVSIVVAHVLYGAILGGVYEVA